MVHNGCQHTDLVCFGTVDTGTASLGSPLMPTSIPGLQSFTCFATFVTVIKTGMFLSCRLLRSISVILVVHLASSFLYDIFKCLAFMK